MADIVILTPTYNRELLLKRLYSSLCNQKNNNFKWMIIDDGSTDHTGDYVKRITKEKKINITYIKQANSGKAIAINAGFNLANNASMIAIVDSDDYLDPSAVDTFETYLLRYNQDEEIGGLFFHYNNLKNNAIISPKLGVLENDVIMNKYDYDRAYGKYDGCICFFNNVIKNYSYPATSNEKYMGPTVLQLMISEKFKIVFSPIVVGVADYQQNGITSSGRKLRMSSPQNMIIYCNLMMSRKASLINKLKYGVSIWPYSLVLKKTIKQTIKESVNPFFVLLGFIPGLFLYHKWK